MLNIVATALRGLRVRPQYEDLIGVAKPDGLEHIKLNSLTEMRNLFDKVLFYHNLIEKA